MLEISLHFMIGVIIMVKKKAKVQKKNTPIKTKGKSDNLGKKLEARKSKGVRG